MRLKKVWMYLAGDETLSAGFEARNKNDQSEDGGASNASGLGDEHSMSLKRSNGRDPH